MRKFLVCAVVAGLAVTGWAKENVTSVVGTVPYKVETVPQGFGAVRRHIIEVNPKEAQRVFLQEVMTLATVDAIENGTNVKAVTRMTDYKGAYESDNPRVSPDGGTVLFNLLEENNNINLWTMASATGLNKIRNTEGSYLNFFGSFSPQGDKIIFSSNRTDPNAHLWEIKAHGGGGGLRRITDSRESDMWAHEDPAGGGFIAFTRFQWGSTKGTIWTYDRKNYLSTQLREGRQPQVSPNGQHIAYSAFDEQEKHWNIWVMGVDGAHPTQLTSNDADNITPSWHPSSKWIIFASNKGSVAAKSRKSGTDLRVHNFDIWMMKVNGEHTSQLTENGSDDDNPVFSPDGKTFYFSSNRGHAVENPGPDMLKEFQARKDIVSIDGASLPLGRGRDIWRALVSDEVLRENIGTVAK
ncbi:MAG: hypothetical protein V1809_13715 [Planctomycetota bacterium]